MGVGTVVWGLVSRWLIVAGSVGDKVNDESTTLLVDIRTLWALSGHKDL